MTFLIDETKATQGRESLSGSRYEGTGHHGGEGMAAGLISTVRKQRQREVKESPLSPFYSVQDPSPGPGTIFLQRDFSSLN